MKETIVTLRMLAVAFLLTALIGCSKPTDIVFGPEPLKQMAEQGQQFKKLPEQDRTLLATYLTAYTMGRAFGANQPPIAGRTVGEVLRDARAWKAKLELEEAEQKKQQEQRAQEAAILKEKVNAERRAMAERFSQAATVAIVDKKVLPKNYDAGRYSAMVLITVAVENKSSKAIRQLKGTAKFLDATGDAIGSLPVDIDTVIPAGKTLRTDMGHGWRLNELHMGEVEQIATRDFSSMKTTFEPSAIAFVDGEILRAPE